MTEALRSRLEAALAGRYRVERELGAGGMALVFLAHDLRHDRDVALKVLRPELSAVLGVERFLQEIRVSARLDHPHILTLIDSGEADGLLWYVLPYVRGESLRQRLDREQQLGLDDALAITRDVASALDHAHGLGLIHRDVKPENILFQEGEAVLADFGIALAVRDAGGSRLTESGLSLGTPQYMSPEQATGSRHLDKRSDVYSLAAVLYEMLAGEPPHSGPTAQAVIAKLLAERPTRLRTIRDAVPEGVDNAVAQALAKVPADRFPSATAFVAALAAEPETAGNAGRRWRNVAGVVLGLVAMVATIIGLRLVIGGEHPRAEPVRVRLTSTGAARLPILSPDGGMVAYADQTCGESAECAIRLMVRETATEGGVAVDSVTSGFIAPAEWSPDGREILYLRESGSDPGFYVIPRLGGTPRRVACCWASYASSQDTMIVATQPARDSGLWLRTVLATTGEVQDSIHVPWFFYTPVGLKVSPDGRWLAVTSWSGSPLLRVIDRRGQIRDSQALTVAGVQWGAGSDALYEWEGHAEQFTAVDLALTSPEGAIVRRAVDRSTGRIARMADTVVRQVPVAAGGALWLSVGDRGRSAVYSAPERRAVRMVLYDAGNGARRPHRLGEVKAAGAVSPGLRQAVSPDARHLGYVEFLLGEAGRRFQVRVQGVADKVTRSVGPALQELVDWGWLDDAHVWIAAPATNHRVRVMTYPVDGGAPAEVAIVDSEYTWFRRVDNHRLAAPSANGDTLLIMASGRATQRVAVPTGAGWVGDIAASPDGKELATWGATPVSAVNPKAWALHLCIYSFAQGSFKCFVTPRLTGIGLCFEWTSDGWIHILAALEGDSSLRLYRFRPLSERLVPEGTPDAIPPDLGGFWPAIMMSRDGHMLVSITETPADIWLIRNFDPAYHR